MEGGSPDACLVTITKDVDARHEAGAVASSERKATQRARCSR